MRGRQRRGSVINRPPRGSAGGEVSMLHTAPEAARRKNKRDRGGAESAEPWIMLWIRVVARRQFFTDE
jgi:hypothetical protein